MSKNNSANPHMQIRKHSKTRRCGFLNACNCFLYIEQGWPAKNTQGAYSSNTTPQAPHAHHYHHRRCSAFAILVCAAGLPWLGLGGRSWSLAAPVVHSLTSCGITHRRRAMLTRWLAVFVSPICPHHLKLLVIRAKIRIDFVKTCYIMTSQIRNS